MPVEQNELDGLLLITPPRVFPDERGFFVETYRENEWAEFGLPRFVQDNHSRSIQNVLRGIHMNLSGGGQGKLVRVSQGTIWDVAVDLRPESATFKRWRGFELSDANHHQVYVPPGFGHGFCVLSEIADVVYKLTTYYDDASEYGIRWDDPELGIQWPVSKPIVSQRDSTNPPLADVLARLGGGVT